LFIGNFYPIELESDFRRNSNCGLDNAANNLQWALISGFQQVCNLEAVTIPALRSYPRYNKSKRILSSNFAISAGKSDGFCVGYLNIFPLSIIDKFRNLTKLLRILFLDNQYDSIVIYSLSTPLLLAVVRLKWKFQKVQKICVIIPDLPVYMSDNNSFLYKFLKFLDNRIINFCLHYVDYFVLLTDHMKRKLPVGDKPYLVMEGVHLPINSFEHREFVKEDIPTFLYSGTLAKKYGILRLIEAFNSLACVDCKLWICGSGDAIDEINQMIKINSNIIYFGELSRAEVHDLQRRATALVNPRLPGDEYTSFSFPSKTIEYLASGTPTILYRLAGIPDEYYRYCIIPDDITLAGLVNCMRAITNMSESELKSIGIQAMNFILTKKNSFSQVSKIINLISNDDRETNNH
jgi:glycosyltransferase involved in cell wall biosynthesis